MPKATKKKKEKQADFTKAKLKLGKGKKQASNATDTSFKARCKSTSDGALGCMLMCYLAIALPGQNPLNRALAAQTGEPTTNAGLSLDDVLLRFRHPNAGVRKEALGGLKEILQIRAGYEVGKVVRAIGGLVSDEDGPVRKALVSFLDWYLASLDKTILTPHLPLLLLQTSSALSHIFPEIRIDACKLVSLLLEHVPKHVVGTWPAASGAASSSRTTLDSGNTILEGLRLAVGLGGDKAASAQMGKLGATGRVTTLKTLLSFVKCALKGSGEEGVFEGWLPATDRKGKGKARVVQVPEKDFSLEGWIAQNRSFGLEDGSAAWEISRLGDAGDSDEQETSQTLSQLYLQLAPILQTTFLESAPTAFAPGQSATNAAELPTALCLTTASLTHTLTRPIFRSESPPPADVRNAVSDFLRRLAPYFPFRSTQTSPTGLTPAMELNLVYANLSVMLAPAPPRLSIPRSARGDVGWRERVKATEEAWRSMRELGKGKQAKSADGRALEEVAEWIVETLSPSPDMLAPALTPTTYNALLPIIWSLLVLAPSPRGAESDVVATVGSAFMSHLLRQGSASTTRSLGDGFLIDLIAVHEQRHPALPFYLQPSSPLRPLLAQWVESVPKVLWELGNKDEQSSERLMRFLLEAGLRGQAAHQAPYSLLSLISFSGIASKLVPFFYLTHPTRGPVPGPWTRLTSPTLRTLALHVAHVWSEWDDGPLCAAVKSAQASKGEIHD